jgi:arabinogalactan oligomer/maltooligosaccharide transport system permease protein
MNLRTFWSLAMVGVALASVASALAIFSAMPEATLRGRFLVIEGGWRYLLGGFGILILGLAGTVYSHARATRPGKAAARAVAAGTHIFLFGVVALTLYPVVYLLAVSFNRNDAMAGALPREGHVLVRSGVFPNPADFALVQYQKVLSQTHLEAYQWLLVGTLLLLLGGWLGWHLYARVARIEAHRDDRANRWFGAGLFLLAAGLVVSIGPAQFYGLNEAGQRTPASSERTILLYIRNTLLVSGITGIFAVVIATTAGYAFARMRFAGRYGTLLSFVFVQMFPSFMALVAIFWLMVQLDLVNTFTGLILAYSGGAIAFSAWIFKGYLESISPALEEAAMVDGATRWGAFTRIILPVSVPMLIFIFLLQFIGTYSEFILANTLLQGQEKWTVGMGLRNFTTGRFDTQWGALSASAVLGSLPILILFYSFQSALTSQGSAGGVKG